ncbi:MAG: DUF975 family protein [Mycoplasmatales bacterium]
MFDRKEVKKRGMELLEGNKLFFFVMILLGFGLSLVPFAGPFAAVFVLYFTVNKSLNVVAGKKPEKSEWFDFDTKSFVTMFLQTLLVGGVLIVSMLILAIVCLILFFIPYIGFLLAIVLFIVYLIAIFILSYALFFSQYIAVEYPNVGVWNSIVFSYKLTKGELINLFLFFMSFIWWYFLVGITFGIAAFFVNGYCSLSTTCLYNELKSKSVDFNEAISKHGYTSL